MAVLAIGSLFGPDEAEARQVCGVYHSARFKHTITCRTGTYCTKRRVCSLWRKNYGWCCAR